MPLKLTALSILALTPTLAQADPAAAPLTYEIFETSVPHFDLESCPADLAQDETFCRATFQHEEIHVFAFSRQGDSPMTGFASYAADGLITLLK